MHVFDKVLIDGEWIEPHGTGVFDVINPTTEEICGRVPAADADDVDRAVRAARRALLDWKLTPAAERGRALLAIADEMERRAEELAAVIVEELGSPAAMTAPYMVSTVSCSQAATTASRSAFATRSSSKSRRASSR